MSKGACTISRCLIYKVHSASSSRLFLRAVSVALASEAARLLYHSVFILSRTFSNSFRFFLSFSRQNDFSFFRFSLPAVSRKALRYNIIISSLCQLLFSCFLKKFKREDADASSRQLLMFSLRLQSDHIRRLSVCKLQQTHHPLLHRGMRRTCAPADSSAESPPRASSASC